MQGVALRINWKNNVTQAVSLASLGQVRLVLIFYLNFIFFFKLFQRAHRTDVRTLVISSDSTFFISASNESAIIWDMHTLSPLNKLVENDFTQINASIILDGDRQAVFGTKALHYK